MSIDGSLQPYTLMIHDTLTLRADGTGLVSGRSWWVVTPPGERDQIMRTTGFAFTLDGASGTDRQLYRRVGPPAA